MTACLTVEQVLCSGTPRIPLNRRALAQLLRDRPKPDTVEPLLSDNEIDTIRAAIVYLGIYGSMRECPPLALCLQHPDEGIVKLAEHSLMCIWMQSGSKRANRRLAAAIKCLDRENYFAASQMLTELVDYEPSFAEAFFQRGVALCYLEQHDYAGRSYRQALQLNPYHFWAAAAIGHTCIESGNFAGALNYYRQALRIHPRMEELPAAIVQLESLVQ